MYNLPTLPKRLAFPRNTCCWKLPGTETFRLASTKFWKIYGTSLQNPDKTICGIYEADEGYSFLQCDQAGAEALIVAYLCRNARFRLLFLNKIKSHTYVALHAFKAQLQPYLKDIDFDELCSCTIGGLKQHPNWKAVSDLIASTDNWESYRRYYFIAKMICHSSNYDITANELRMHILLKSEGRVNLTIDQAKSLLELYHELFPEIREWHKEIQQLLYNDHTLYNLQGYPRVFTGVLTPKVFKKAYAFIPQSTVGTITNICLTRLQNYIEAQNLPWDVLNNKHDSVLIQVPDGEIQHGGRVLTEYMNQSLTHKGVTFNMRSEVQFGKNWKPQSESNPDGLRQLVLTT